MIALASNEINIELLRFIAFASQAPTFSPAHISLFVVILTEMEHQGSNPILIYGKDLMRKAKIGGLATYHRIIKELHTLQLIRYEPSYNPAAGSIIYILKYEV